MRAMKRDARFSRCRQYRYALWRWWGDDAAATPPEASRYALIIGLNPSTADHLQDDPTIRRCIGFARDWGYDGLCVANLFAWRATYPEDLKAAADPVGPRNNYWLRRLAANAEVVVAGWGNHGLHLDRAARVRGMLPDCHILRLNTSGEPAHPLYLPKTLRPQPWS